MGLLQKAIETYDAMSCLAGMSTAGEEPLAPIGHIVTKPDIEITIDAEGNFLQARAVGKEEPKIIIPVTEDSAGRTSAAKAHALCDSIAYISGLYPDKSALYTAGLKEWADSDYSSPKVEAVLRYVNTGTLLQDLDGAQLLKRNKDGNIQNEKALICWIVNGLGEESGPVWNDKKVLKGFEDFYLAKKSSESAELCMLSGKMLCPAVQHIKGVISLNGNAKIISANDNANFTYRGRFEKPEQAVSIGYISSQKAHNALKWLAANEGTRIVYGGRTFICWNPQGNQPPMPSLSLLGFSDQPAADMTKYKELLRKKLLGYTVNLPDNADVVIAAFDAATTGRLAVAYYNELQYSDFLERLVYWDETCCFLNGGYGIQAPTLLDIVRFAFGTQRGQDDKAKMEIDDKILSQHMQRLISCRVDQAVFPLDIMRALVIKAENLQIYNPINRGRLLFTVCSVIRKYKIDTLKEECQVALEPEKKDRSYQYGRLLAVLERAERSTYEDNDGKRETNAIRMQQVFVRRPAYASKIIIEQLKTAYYPKLSAGSRVFYDRLIGQILEEISECGEQDFNKPLGENYLLGYYLQKNSFYKKNSSETSTVNNTEDENNE